MSRTILLSLALMSLGTAASAEVVARHADGFTLRYTAALETSPDTIPAALANLPKWWDGAHTYSGSSANLTMTLTPGGCWCEALADGRTFEHGRVVAVDAREKVVLNAPLGPLNGTATRSDLTYSWTSGSKAAEGGTMRLTLEFVVEGTGLGAAADAVDGVMQAGFERLSRYIETGAPTP